MEGNPSNNGSNACYLRNGESLELSIDTASLPGTAQFTSITFYPDSSEAADRGATVTFAGATSPVTIQGYRPGASNPIALFSVSWNGSNLGAPITITDSESGNADDSAWFSIQVGDRGSGRSWQLDPEIVNTGGTKSGWQPGEASTLQRVAVA